MDYHKLLYVFDQSIPKESIIRNYREADYPELIRIQQESFPPPFPSEIWWNEEQLSNHVTLFPEGALCVEVDGRIVGSITGNLVKFNPAHPEHTWEDITDSGYIRNFDPNGDTLYIVDICVSPAYRKLGLGKWLMQSMYEVVVHKRLKRLVGGGRMPGYHKVSDRMTANEYLTQVMQGKIQDPVITFLLRCGRTPIVTVINYLPDEESCNYAVLMEWRNPFHVSKP